MPKLKFTARTVERLRAPTATGRQRFTGTRRCPVRSLSVRRFGREDLTSSRASSAARNGG